ncbi:MULTISPECIES: hypothetical protein [Lysobacter]|uniref:Uncharacterized protein n=1 Tax=Lysobacter yananisis TaxID=1003114 RepID=A0ABY9P2S3_9GAMM|nr:MULTISPECIES: hypothetical protein [Lysobacter]QQQ02788.1 hypothetical protein JHW41_07410 [Lysobacter enzymogenes]WMT01189.1 hypothetical protein RDV84_14410 [Lysobacter yananisis]
MRTEERWRGIFTLLVYGLIGVRDLESFFPRTLAKVKNGEGIIFSPEEMRHAIEMALNSSEDLTKLEGVLHSDEDIRRYFSKVLEHLPD